MVMQPNEICRLRRHWARAHERRASLSAAHVDGFLATLQPGEHFQVMSVRKHIEAAELVEHVAAAPK